MSRLSLLGLGIKFELMFVPIESVILGIAVPIVFTDTVGQNGQSSCANISKVYGKKPSTHLSLFFGSSEAGTHVTKRHPISLYKSEILHIVISPRE